MFLRTIYMESRAFIVTIYKTYQIRMNVCVHCATLMKHEQNEFISKLFVKQLFYFLVINTIF